MGGSIPKPPKVPKCPYARPPSPPTASCQEGRQGSCHLPLPHWPWLLPGRRMIHPYSCSWAGLHFAPSHLHAWSSPGRASRSDKLNLTQPKLSSSCFHPPHWSPAQRCTSPFPTPHEPLGGVGRVGPEQPCLPAGPPWSLGPCLLTMAPSTQRRASSAGSAQQSGHSQEERNQGSVQGQC